MYDENEQLLKIGLKCLKITCQKISFMKKISQKMESLKAFLNLYLQLKQNLIRYRKMHFRLDFSFLMVEKDKTKINLPSRLHKIMIMIKKENKVNQFSYLSTLYNTEYGNYTYKMPPLV